MVYSSLKINDIKTELILVGSEHMLSKCNIKMIKVADYTAMVVNCVRDIGLKTANLHFNAHITYSQKGLQTAFNTGSSRFIIFSLY